MKVLVVDGSGFIGKTLCSQLLKSGTQVFLCLPVLGRGALNWPHQLILLLNSEVTITTMM